MSGTNIFALTKISYLSPGGIFISTNSGASWTSISSGLENVPVNTIQASGTNLYAGTDGYGVWRRPLSDFGISAVTETALRKKEIQSYPNPFSQSTQITFTSPDAGYADISIVNLLGEQVASIFSGELDAGPHNFTWNADGTSAPRVPDGMYECLVRMNGRVEKVGMVLMH